MLKYGIGSGMDGSPDSLVESPNPQSPPDGSAPKAQALAVKHLSLESLVQDVNRLRKITWAKGDPRPFPDAQLAAVKLGLEIHGALKGNSVVDNRSVNLTLTNFRTEDVTDILTTLQRLSARFNAVDIPFNDPNAETPEPT